MSRDALQDLFLDELKNLYDAEKQLVKALQDGEGNSVPSSAGRISKPFIEEGSHLMEEDSEPPVLDAGLVCMDRKLARSAPLPTSAFPSPL